MADPGLQAFLFAEADRTMKALLDNKLLPAEQHSQIVNILKQAKDRGSEAGPGTLSKPGELATGYPFGVPPPLGFNPYMQQPPPQQVAYAQAGPPQQMAYMSQNPYPAAYPAAYPAPGYPQMPLAPYGGPQQGPYGPPQINQQPQAPPAAEPSKPAPAAEAGKPPAPHEHSKIGQLAQQVGSNVVNSMGNGFGFTMGSQAAHSLWNKF